MKDPSINLISVLLLLGAAQGVFLALVLLGSKTGNRIANRILALLLLVFSAGLIEGFMSAAYYYLRYPSLIGIEWPLSFAYGPLVYFYIKSLTEPEQRINRWQLSAHFIPALLFYVYLIPVFTMDPKIKAQQWFFQNSDYQNYSSVIDPILYIIVLQISAYLILSRRLLDAHSERIKRNFSSIENINLFWLRSLIMVFLCLFVVWMFFAIFSQFLGVYKQTEYLFNFLTAVTIYVMGYKGIRQSEIFAPREIMRHIESAINQTSAEPKAIAKENQMKAAIDEAGKYAKSSLSSEQSEKILTRLTQLMKKEKPYLEMGLTLPMLSNMLDVSPNHLSQVINGKLNKSFFDFVNAYRVEKAKKCLISPEADRFSILGIAMDAGFSSKSAFYSAFKKHTGMTPSQFKEQLISPDCSQVRQML